MKKSMLLLLTMVIIIGYSCKKNETTNNNGTNFTFYYSAWSPCLNGVETRAYTSSPIGGTPPADSISRTCSTASNCTFNYSIWSACSNGTQTRTYSTSPGGCSGNPPSDSLTRICGIVYTFTYDPWSSCINGTQTRSYISTPSGGTPPSDSTSRACYNNFKINSVILNAFPATDNGTNWDPIPGSTDPDIFFNIDSSATNLYYGGASYLSNINLSNLPSAWPSLASPQVIYNFSATYYISLFDSDFASFGDADDPIGQIPFMMNDHLTGYPSSFQITNGTSTVTINGTWY
jgi:hypothetical protein